MRGFLTLSALILIALGGYAQVVPELLTADHYLPYLSEKQKQQQIVNHQIETIRKNYPKTSEELYPQLYLYTHRDYLSPLKGTSADPQNAFPDYSKNTFQKPTASSVVPSSLYNTNVSIEQRNLAAIEADMAAYSSRKKESERIIEEANRVLYKPTINYQLGIHNDPTAGRFIKAFDELKKMLDGTQKIDFLKAVWLVESAVDTTLSWQSFQKLFKDDLQIISSLMIQDHVSPNDNLGKIMAIYKYMADTTKVFVKAKERIVVSKPMLYDYDDYEAKKDIKKVFVSKLLRTGSGQCMSLPMLYYLFAKAFNTNVNLAFAPEHSYITFKDNDGNTQNIELTGKMFTTQDFYVQTGFIKSEQIKSEIYLKPISEIETIAHLLTTLTISYVRTLGTDERVLEMGLTAHKYAPKDLSANMILAGYLQDLYNNILRQYDVLKLSETEFGRDQQARQIRENMYKAVDHLKKDLGYSKMPDWAYQKWLNGVNELANKKQHIVKRRQLEQQLNR